MDVVLASSNAGKIKELQDMLADLGVVIIPQQELSIPDIEETGLCFVENAILKARNAALLSGKPAIADDSGLEVDLLDGQPGIYSARYGGEEFCIVLPETNIDEAYAVAERMRENIEQYQFPDINGKKITISAGAAEYSINDKTATTFLTRADDALYRAKSMGRNRVCKSEQATPQA